MEVLDKNEYISKIEVVRILQKAYAEGRIKAKDGLASVLDDINAADKIKASPLIDIHTINMLIQARLRGLQKVKLDALKSSDLNVAYMMKYAEDVCYEILADIDAITGKEL